MQESVDRQLESLLKDNNLGQAAVLLERHVAAYPDDATALFRLGKLWWRMGERAKAMSCYARSEALDPDGPASHALEMAKSIEDFFNPDLLNP